MTEQRQSFVEKLVGKPAEYFQGIADAAAKKTTLYNRVAQWHRLGCPDGFISKDDLPSIDGAELLGDLAGGLVRRLLRPRPQRKKGIECQHCGGALEGPVGKRKCAKCGAPDFYPTPS